MPKSDYLEDIFPTLYSFWKKKVWNEKLRNYRKTVDSYVGVWFGPRKESIILEKNSVMPGIGGWDTYMGTVWVIVWINKGTRFEAGKFLGMGGFWTGW